MLVLSCSVPSTFQANVGRGAELYARHCSLCHGEWGRGDGDAAELMFPKPRDFGEGQFRLVSTDNGVPSDADLVRTLRRGMPGSVMPSYSWLGEEDLAALAEHVRDLAVAGMTVDLQVEGEDRDAARLIAEQALTPGATIAVDAAPAFSTATLARGARVFQAECASCHDVEVVRPAPAPDWGHRDRFQWARDFTKGILKGGASHEELVCRIRNGLPGSVMRPTRLDEGDEAALAVYVKTLLEPGAEERMVQRRQRVVAPRVASGLADQPDETVWAAAEDVEVVLAPLIWLGDHVWSARVRAVHDGEHLAVRLQWNDQTRDDRLLGDSRHGDAAALQFCAAEEPPPFGMGSHGQPVNIWHWKAFDPAAASALLDQVPHSALGNRQLDAPVYLPATSAPAREVQAEGFRSASRFAGDHEAIAAHASWRDGEWTVVFVRALRPEAAGERQIELRAGGRVHLAGAIWDGRARAGDAQKSVTVWHELVLEP